MIADKFRFDSLAFNILENWCFSEGQLFRFGAAIYFRAQNGFTNSSTTASERRLTSTVAAVWFPAAGTK